MTHGTIAGMLLTDLILGRDNPWAKLYDPSRKTLRAAKEFLSENLNVARQYADWLTGGEVGSLADIPHDAGAVVRHGLSKAAVYRDGSGALHSLSAVCPHLGLHRVLEPVGENVGLSLSRLALHLHRRGPRRTRQQGAGTP
jgi:hypothetical protein